MQCAICLLLEAILGSISMHILKGPGGGDIFPAGCGVQLLITNLCLVWRKFGG